MSERLEELERKRRQIERDWGGMAGYELTQLGIEIESERRSSGEKNYRDIFGCGNSFHGRKYS